MNVVAVVQARLGSTRFPNKILLKLNSETLLEFLINRLKNSKRINKIVLATTDKSRDDLLVEYAKKLAIAYYRGSEDDVLDRTYHAAKANKADIVVRITSDCPLNDPLLIDSMIGDFISSKCDYLCNRQPPTFPDGFDIEVFSFAALEQAWKNATFKFEREHVTPYISDRPQVFKIKNITYKKDCSQLRLTVDYEEDFELVKKVYDTLYPKNKLFTLDDIVDFLDHHPELVKINAKYVRDEKYHREKAEELKKTKK